LESPIIAFEIESPLTPSEILARLQNVTERRPLIRFQGAWGKRQKFEGVVTDDGYRLHLILAGRDSFNPRIHGQVRTLNGHTILTGTMTPDSFVLPFLVFFNGLAVIGFLLDVLLIRSISATVGLVLMLTFGLVMFLTMPGFVSQSRAAARVLANVVDATRLRLYGPPAEGQWRFVAGLRELKNESAPPQVGLRPP
jgi:hypothetical protein